jgi:hypothetical protein
MISISFLSEQVYNILYNKKVPLTTVHMCATDCHDVSNATTQVKCISNTGGGTQLKMRTGCVCHISQGSNYWHLNIKLPVKKMKIPFMRNILKQFQDNGAYGTQVNKLSWTVLGYRKYRENMNIL